MKKQYDLYPNGQVECSKCGTHEDVTHEDVTTDEDGIDICTDCLFERECEKI